MLQLLGSIYSPSLTLIGRAKCLRVLSTLRSLGTGRLRKRQGSPCKHRASLFSTGTHNLRKCLFYLPVPRLSWWIFIGTWTCYSGFIWADMITTPTLLQNKTTTKKRCLKRWFHKKGLPLPQPSYGNHFCLLVCNCESIRGWAQALTHLHSSSGLQHCKHSTDLLN